MKLLKKLLELVPAFLGGSLAASPTVNKLKLHKQQRAIEMALRGTRTKDDISRRIACRTINQRKARNLKRWARANGSLA